MTLEEQVAELRGKLTILEKLVTGSFLDKILESCSRSTSAEKRCEEMQLRLTSLIAELNATVGMQAGSFESEESPESTFQNGSISIRNGVRSRPAPSGGGGAGDEDA